MEDIGPRRDKLVARKLVNLIKTCSKHKEPRSALEYFVEYYLKTTQFKELENNEYPWGDFKSVIGRLANFDFHELQDQLKIISGIANSNNDLRDLMILWSKHLKRVITLHDYSPQAITRGQHLVNQTISCFDLHVPEEIAVVRRELLALIDGLLSNQWIRRQVHATTRIKKQFQSSRFLHFDCSENRLDKEIITELITTLLHKLSNQVSSLKVGEMDLQHHSKKLSTGKFNLPIRGLCPEYMQVETDQQFTIKVDPNPIMHKKGVIAILSRNLKPHAIRVPIRYHGKFLKFNDLVDIDVSLISIVHEWTWFCRKV